MQSVLIIDDSSVIRSRLRALFINYGFEIAGVADNADLGIQLYKEHKPSIVTMDIMMPGKNGIDATIEIKRYDPKAKIIMITSEGEEEKVLESVKAGALYFVIKPFKEEQLIKIINSVLQNSITQINIPADTNNSLILAVDDSATSLAMINNNLKELGYSIVTAKTGRKGIDLAVAGNPDLILLDIEMPDMNGYQVLEELKGNKITNNIPVIMLTAHTHKDFVTQALKYGIVDYIVKSASREIFKKKVNTALLYSKIQKRENAAEKDRHVTILRQNARTTISFRVNMSSDDAKKEIETTLSGAFISMILKDIIVLDIRALAEISQEDISDFKAVITKFGDRELHILAGRHYGPLMALSEFKESVHLFITPGDLEIFFESKI